MAYFLKKAKLKGRTYLSICESFYSHEKKGTAHRTYKSLSSVETHIANGIADPIAHFQKEVDELNEQRNDEGVKKIGNESATLSLGYFPLKNIMDELGVEQFINYFNLSYNFEYNLFELMSSLVYARCIRPCSKRKTFHDVLPTLYDKPDYSYDQLLSGLNFMGNVYDKFVEIFTVMTKEKLGLDTKTTYFDCTNFYFEIDREDSFRRKGPSKERRLDPIIGLGLLLDNNHIPIGMKIFPGNESEKPVLRDVITSLKKKNNIDGRTIHVADKGLNCAQNIAFSKVNRDGYIFSKSVKMLPKIEKEWVLLNNDYKEVKDEQGKILYLYKSCIDKYPYTFEHEGKTQTVELTEKRIITYNPSLASKQKSEILKMVDKASSIASCDAKKRDYGEASKYFNFSDKEGKKAKAVLNEKKIEEDLELCGFNMIVTSEVNMSSKDIYEAYHRLWRIEQSFRIMKSDLEARPIFLQDEDSIKGHFLICYISVLLERIFEFKILKNNFSHIEIFDFIRDFKATPNGLNYINTAKKSELLSFLEGLFNLPLSNYFLTETNIKSIFKNKISFKNK